MGKKIKLIIHYGGSMRKEDDTYVYDGELGCQFVEWELANIKWDTFSDFCFSLKISAPILFIYSKDALEDMSKVQYAYESINMVDLQAMLCIAEVDGTMEIFLEHEVSESTLIVHYLVSSQHEDRVEKESGDKNDNDNNRFENDDDNEADDEAGSESEEEDDKEDGSESEEEDDKEDGGEDGDDRPREDVDPEPSEDEDGGEDGNAYCSTIRSSENLYEVVEFDHGYTVRMLTHECACRRWDLTGIPCKHAICVMDDNQEDAEQYVVNYYHCAVMRSTYNDNIKPVNGKELWTAVNKPPIGVPEFRKPRGRPKKCNRKKEPFEDLENAGKSTRHGRVQHCSNCGEAEHTSRSCKNESVVMEGPKNRRGRPKKFPEKQPVRPKRPTKPRQKKATPTGTSSTQPVQGADSGCCFPATSSAPEPAVSNKKQAKKRKRGPPLEISNAADIPTVSATLMSPFTAHRFDVFSSIARGSQPPSKPPSEPNQP